jgi:hypothetical protein
MLIPLGFFGAGGPVDKYIFMAVGASAGLSVYNFNAGFGAKYANPATMPSFGDGQVGITVTSKADSFVVGGSNDPYIFGYPFSSSGIGVKFANPAVAVGSDPGRVAFSPNDNWIANTNGNNPRTQVRAWTSTGGFGTKVTDPASGPFSSTWGVAWNPTGDRIVWGYSASPYLMNYVWNGSSFGSKLSDPPTPPAGSPTNQGVTFSNTGNAVFMAAYVNPGFWGWAFSGGNFSTRFAAPPIFGAPPAQNVAYSPAPNNDIAIATGSYNSAEGYALVYPFTGSGYGTRYANATQPLPFYGNGVSFSRTSKSLAFGSSDQQFIYAWPWNPGYGTRYASPATNPGGEVQAIAFG